jgi:hypothetical protein
MSRRNVDEYIRKLVTGIQKGDVEVPVTSDAGMVYVKLF